MEQNEFKSLKDLMDDELNNLRVFHKFPSLESFINDGKRSAEFIKTMLKDDSFDIPDEATDLYKVAEMRARHSAVTFLMGLAFRRFASLFDNIPTIVNKEKELAMQMWLITSLYHDKSYSSDFIKKPSLDLKQEFVPFLLTDEYDNENLDVLNNFSQKYPNSLAYTYEIILKYDKYAISRLENYESKEKRDHGILGGVMMFKELSNKAIKSGRKNELQTIKACSLAVAQHNIFKAKEKDDDKYKKFELYDLLSSSQFRIKREKALLLFLSLVDTVECVKKFSKGQNNNKFLETLTTLKNIKMAVNEQEIQIDISELAKHIKEKNDEELNNAFESYQESLKMLSTWTVFNVAKVNNIFSIKLGNIAEISKEKVLVGAV